MDISMIVPCYNVAPYIKNLLLSFHMLNLKDISYEILFVIEDTNNDNVKEVIEQYMNDMNYSFLTSNGGTVGLARNTGLEAAQGDYIWFIDADDWIINPEVLQYTINEFHRSNLNIIQIGFVSNFFNMKHYSMVWQYIFKKSFFDLNVKFNSEKHYEDNDFMQKCFKKLGTYSIATLNVPCYYYNYERPGSLMYNLRRGIE